MPVELVEALEAQGLQQSQHTELTTEIVASSDVIYMTNIPSERFDTPEQYAAVKGMYMVTKDTLHLAKPDMIVMHPLPRQGEIAASVDSDPRAAYFRQKQNSLYTSMALLTLLAGVQPACSSQEEGIERLQQESEL
jgi:aspartate carbamoyltransferase catalytic subunit